MGVNSSQGQFEFATWEDGAPLQSEALLEHLVAQLISTADLLAKCLSADAGDLRSIHRNLKTTSLKIIN
jgi:hypothetical protein